MPESLIGSPRTLESRLALARLREKHSTPEEASKLYEKLATEQPDNAQVRHRLAIMAVRKSQMDTAMRLFNEALQLEPDNAIVHNDFGYALYLDDQLTEAIAHLTKAVELEPTLQAAWVNLGLVYGQQQNFDQATVAFRKAEVSEAALHCNVAYLYARHNQLEKARDEYVIALREDSDCQVAAQGLLQVSQGIQGAEPVTVAATVAKARPQPLPIAPTSGSDKSQTNDATDITQFQSPQSGIPPFSPESE